MAYIYKISNNIDCRVYIGSTINLKKRWGEHKRSLLKGNHQNKHLQNFVNKYGLDVLKFNVIEVVDNKKQLISEQFYLDNTANKFNIAHAAMIVGVTQQSISKALKSKGGKSEISLYKKEILLNNLDLFDKNCHPQPELVEMLKSL